MPAARHNARRRHTKFWVVLDLALWALGIGTLADAGEGQPRFYRRGRSASSVSLPPPIGANPICKRRRS